MFGNLGRIDNDYLLQILGGYGVKILGSTVHTHRQPDESSIDTRDTREDVTMSFLLASL